MHASNWIASVCYFASIHSFSITFPFCLLTTLGMFKRISSRTHRVIFFCWEKVLRELFCTFHLCRRAELQKLQWQILLREGLRAVIKWKTEDEPKQLPVFHLIFYSLLECLSLKALGKCPFSCLDLIEFCQIFWRRYSRWPHTNKVAKHVELHWIWSSLTCF